MKKRILSLLMVGAMTAGMLAGCGSKTDAPADNTAKEETPATEEAKEGGRRRNAPDRRGNQPCKGSRCGDHRSSEQDR